MSLDEFRANIDAAVRLLSKPGKRNETPPWLNEGAIRGASTAGFDKLRADLGFPLGLAVARFRLIARQVAAADGTAEPQQIDEAADTLLAIAKILRSLPPT
jgi:hypothetical protein